MFPKMASTSFRWRQHQSFWRTTWHACSVSSSACIWRSRLFQAKCQSCSTSLTHSRWRRPGKTTSSKRRSSLCSCRLLAFRTTSSFIWKSSIQHSTRLVLNTRRLDCDLRSSSIRSSCHRRIDISEQKVFQVLAWQSSVHQPPTPLNSRISSSWSDTTKSGLPWDSTNLSICSSNSILWSNTKWDQSILQLGFQRKSRSYRLLTRNRNLLINC